MLNKHHNRERFDCGKEVLNDYLKYQANQDVKRKLSVCFVLIDSNSNDIQGYYTLSNSGIPLEHFPDRIRNKFPQSYKVIPTTLLGRLAISTKFQGKGIGHILLIDALKRSLIASQEIGSYAVVVDQLDEKSKTFYEKYDFIELADTLKMFLSIKTINDLFNKSTENQNLK